MNTNYYEVLELDGIGSKILAPHLSDTHYYIIINIIKPYILLLLPPGIIMLIINPVQCVDVQHSTLLLL